MQFCISTLYCNFALQYIAILHYNCTSRQYKRTFKGMSDEIEKTDGVYFDMNEDKRYSNITAGKTNGNVTAGKNGNDNNANSTARGHTRN